MTQIQMAYYARLHRDAQNQYAMQIVNNQQMILARQRELLEQHDNDPGPMMQREAIAMLQAIAERLDVSDETIRARRRDIEAALPGKDAP